MCKKFRHQIESPPGKYRKWRVLQKLRQYNLTMDTYLLEKFPKIVFIVKMMDLKNTYYVKFVIFFVWILTQIMKHLRHRWFFCRFCQRSKKRSVQKVDTVSGKLLLQFKLSLKTFKHRYKDVLKSKTFIA